MVDSTKVVEAAAGVRDDAAEDETGATTDEDWPDTEADAAGDD